MRWIRTLGCSTQAVGRLPSEVANVVTDGDPTYVKNFFANGQLRVNVTVL